MKNKNTEKQLIKKYISEQVKKCINEIGDTPHGEYMLGRLAGRKTKERDREGFKNIKDYVDKLPGEHLHFKNGGFDEIEGDKERIDRNFKELYNMDKNISFDDDDDELDNDDLEDEFDNDEFEEYKYHFDDEDDDVTIRHDKFDDALPKIDDRIYETVKLNKNDLKYIIQETKRIILKRKRK